MYIVEVFHSRMWPEIYRNDQTSHLPGVQKNFETSLDVIAPICLVRNLSMARWQANLIVLRNWPFDSLHWGVAFGKGRLALKHPVLVLVSHISTTFGRTTCSTRWAFSRRRKHIPTGCGGLTPDATTMFACFFFLIWASNIFWIYWGLMYIGSTEDSQYLDVTNCFLATISLNLIKNA